MSFSGQSSMPDAVKRLVTNGLRDARCCLPARVTAIYPDRLMIDVEYLVDTRYADGTNSEFALGYDIPLQIQSANQGIARITFPTTVGDTVLVLFSDRDYNNLFATDGKSTVTCFDPRPHPIAPVGAIPCVFTIPNARTLDTSNIVIENGSTTIKIAPSGDITMNTTSKVSVNAPLTELSGDLTVAGDVTIEGDTTLNGDNNTVTKDLSISTIDFVTHTHGGVDTGIGNTDVPNTP